MNRTKLKLRDEDINELTRVTCYTVDQIYMLKNKFEQMANDNVDSDGQITLEAFCSGLRMRADSKFTKFLFDHLDRNQDGYLGFFEYIRGLDGFVSLDFKEKLKSFFELFCDDNRFISKSKVLKIAKDVISSFEGINIPDDYILESISKSKNEGIQLTSNLFFETDKAFQKFDKTKFDGDKVITLDQFYDNFMKIFRML